MAILLLALSLAALHALCSSLQRRRQWHLVLAVAIAAAVVVSAGTAGFRPTLVPLWLWAASLTGLLICRAPSAGVRGDRNGKWRTRFVFAGGVLLSWGAFNLASLTLAEMTLPALSGPYPVAKHQWLVQSQRRDVHSPDPFARREFLVNVYYPTLVNDRMAHAPYLSPAMTAALRGPLDYFRRPAQDPIDKAAASVRSSLFQYDVARMQSQAWRGFGSGLSPALDAYPIVIFSPGYGWFADMHSFQLEQLASHGYLVFAITHPGDTPLVEYPDGRRVEWGWSDAAWVEDRSTFRARQRRRSELGLALARSTAAPSDAGLREMLAVVSEPIRTAPLSVRKDDVIDLLDRLESLNNGKPAGAFAGRLDMNNIAVMGMSYGGATASEVCLEDRRCKVVINLDGAEFGRLLFEPNTRPALWLYAMNEDGNGWQDEFLRRIAYERYEGPAYRVGFEGAVHQTFADFPFWPREVSLADLCWPRALWAGDARVVSGRILEYELDFLDHYLKGKDLVLLATEHSGEGMVVHNRNLYAAP